MIEGLPPGLVLILGALGIPLLRGRWRQGYMLALSRTRIRAGGALAFGLRVHRIDVRVRTDAGSRRRTKPDFRSRLWRCGLPGCHLRPPCRRQRAKCFRAHVRRRRYRRRLRRRSHQPLRVLGVDGGDLAFSDLGATHRALLPGGNALPDHSGGIGGATARGNAFPLRRYRDRSPLARWVS